MPRSLLVKHRVVQLQDSPFPQQPTRKIISWPPQNANFSPSDEDRTASDCSSDSGRESTLPAEPRGSSSFPSGRPSYLNFEFANVSSSSSSDSLSSKSPVSPYPLGHISLLPRILENLAVTPHNKYNQRLNFALPSDGLLSEQLFRKIDVPKEQVIARPAASGQLRRAVAAADCVGVNPQSSPDDPLLSPQSRKRTNSIENPPIATPVNNGSKIRKPKIARKEKKSDDLTSPVSGTFIREESDVDKDVIIIRRGDLDRSLHVVEDTEEARAELAKIENKIGAYDCKLCKLNFPDAFGLAGHNCSRIVHIEYVCPECGKSFHCPANLASHRRWHKPKSEPATPKTSPKKLASETGSETTVAESFVEKDRSSNMPFKKRFLFKNMIQNKSVVSEREDVSENIPKKIEKDQSDKKAEISKTEIPLPPDVQHFFCHVCHSIIPGAQAFAKHWQKCLLTTEQETKLPSLFKATRF